MTESVCPFCDRPDGAGHEPRCFMLAELPDRPPVHHIPRCVVEPTQSDRYRVVETDNFGGDYPDEKFLPIPPVTQAQARTIAEAINGAFYPDASRYWKVVPGGYVLQPGFES